MINNKLILLSFMFFSIPHIAAEIKSQKSNNSSLSQPESIKKKPKKSTQDKEENNEIKEAPAKIPAKISHLARLKAGISGSAIYSFVGFSVDKARRGNTAAFSGTLFFDYLSPKIPFPIGTSFNIYVNSMADLVSLDANAHLKYPFKLAIKNFNPELYFLLPLGFSIGHFTSSRMKGEPRPLGFNIAGFLGKDFAIYGKFGINVEAGYRYRYLARQTTQGKPYGLHFHDFSIMFGPNYIF